MKNMTMVAFFAAFGVLPAALWSATIEFDKNVRLTYDFGGKPRPAWDNGSLVFVDGNKSSVPSVVVLGMDGNRESVPFSIPGAQLIDIRSASHGRDNSIALCGSTYDASGRGSGFVATIGADRSSTLVTRVHPYTPYRVVMATDGTIWAAGIELIDGKENQPGVDSSRGVIRHFDKSGNLIGSFIPRNQIESQRMITWGRMVAAQGRIGWYTGPVIGPGSCYYEITNQGVVSHFPGAGLSSTGIVTGVALTDDGQTFITTAENDKHTWQLMTLSHADSAWSPLTAPSVLKEWSALCGGMGNTLAFQTKDRFNMVLATEK